jgi:iron complex transport system ATP-binding protein
MSRLAVRSVDLRAGGRTIVSSASFSAASGSMTGVIGPNGAGKSTLLASLVGLRAPAAGTIQFEGTDLVAIPASERARICAYVEQSATTSERLTVKDVAALGRVPHQPAWQSRPSAHDEIVIADAITALQLSGFVDRLYQTLSGGEQQRVQLARALAQEPRLLVLDEPTSHLDIEAQLTTLELLSQRAAIGCTVVMALHDLNLAARYCDHLVVMKDGTVVAEGSPRDVLTSRLLLEVYGVYASIVDLPDSPTPLVVYHRARGPQKSG